MDKPTLGRIVLYQATKITKVPAVIVATHDGLHADDVSLWEESGGQRGIPPLTTPLHVHLVCLAPGRVGGNATGSYQAWNVPLNGSEYAPVEKVGEQNAETWAWPTRAPVRDGV